MAKNATQGYAAKPTSPLFNNGVYIRTVLAVIVTAAADAAGKVHTLVRGLPLGAQVVGIRLAGSHAAIGGASDLDIGFHRSDNEVVLDKDILVDGADISGAIAYATDLMQLAPGAGTLIQNIGEMLSLAADKCPAGGVDLTATFNSDVSAAGTVKLFVDIAFPA
jgi:hypothetical protein